MSIKSGLNLDRTGLVFSVDPFDIGYSTPAIGCGLFNGAASVRCQVSGATLPFINNVKLANRSYFTAFAIDYPEGNYGGNAAQRDGITPGYNALTGSKLSDFGRALNYLIYSYDSSSWVWSVLYDTYAYSAEVDRFVADYHRNKGLYPNSVHVVAGSHRDSNHSAAEYAVLRDLGAPANVDSIIGFSSPEWILVGKPGLGVGRAYGWVFQNYETNPDQVAHINFGLPIKPTGGFEFDANSAWMKVSSANNPLHNLNSAYTLLGWCKQADGVGPHHTILATQLQYRWGAKLMSYYHGGIGWWIANADGSGDYMLGGDGIVNQGWKMLAGTRSASGLLRLYVDGVPVNQAQGPTGLTKYGDADASYIGADYHSYGQGIGYNGEIGLTQAWNRELTDTEILKIYTSTRKRFESL